MAAQPPGPGLPRHAPSVKISTSDGSAIEPVAADIHDAAVKTQLAQKFERILRSDQRSRRLVEPIEQPCQQKAQRAAARKKRERGEFSCGERPRLPIAVE